jgi:hypothetical protein
MYAAALIRFHPNEDSVVCTYLEQKQERLVPVNHEIIPKYNMSKITPITQHFKIPEEKVKNFLEVLQSKEGHAIVNILKNIKTNEIINRYLKIKKEQIAPLSESAKKHYNLLFFIEDMMAENLGNTYNTLPKKLLCLSREDIYNEFLKRGLIK